MITLSRHICLLACALITTDALAADKPVLIAWTKSTYRAAVAGQIQDTLKKQKLQIATRPIEKLKDIKAADYAAVVVLGCVQDWRKGSFKEFLKNPDARLKKKLVVVTCALKATWKSKLRGVHSITTASRKPLAAAVVADAVKAVNAIVKD